MKMKRTPTQLVLSLLLYVVGLFVLAMGIALSVNTNLGTSAVNSTPLVLSYITSIDLGICVVLVYIFFIALQILILRRNFRWISLTQLIFSSLFGYFVNLTQFIIGDFALPTLAGKIVMLVASIICIGIGVALYVEVDLIPMPMEGLTLAIATKTPTPFHTIKTVVDCLCVLLASTLSLIFLHALVGVHIGTVITALTAGKMVGIVKVRISPYVKRICFGEAIPQPE